MSTCVGVDEAATGIGMGVGIDHVGLDVVDGGAIHEVGTKNVYQRTVGGVEVDVREAHRRESYAVGTERRACGENSHTGVAAKQRRAHHGADGSMAVGRKLPHKPQIVERLNATQGVGIAILWHKLDCALQILYQSALLRNAKLRGKR